MNIFLTSLKWFGLGIIVLFGIVVLIRIPYVMQAQRTEEIVARIHATKLTMDDVTGAHLPPDPGTAADATVQGIDANNNGIRDDVELAIFKAYPDSAKTRAVLLQYALVMQMQMTLPVLNGDTVTASVEDNESRADVCLWTLSSRDDLTKFLADMDRYENFVKNLQLNNDLRKKYMNDFYEYIQSYSSSNDGCDIDPSSLPN